MSDSSKKLSEIAVGSHFTLDGEYTLLRHLTTPDSKGVVCLLFDETWQSIVLPPSTPVTPVAGTPPVKRENPGSKVKLAKQAITHSWSSGEANGDLHYIELSSGSWGIFHNYIDTDGNFVLSKVRVHLFSSGATNMESDTDYKTMVNILTETVSKQLSGASWHEYIDSLFFVGPESKAIHHYNFHDMKGDARRACLTVFLNNGVYGLFTWDINLGGFVLRKHRVAQPTSVDLSEDTASESEYLPESMDIMNHFARELADNAIEMERFFRIQTYISASRNRPRNLRLNDIDSRGDNE